MTVTTDQPGSPDGLPDFDQPMALSFHADDSLLVVSGCVEEDEAVSLKAAIADHTDDHTHALTVDLSAVTYFPSAAVGVVARAMGRSREAGVALDLVAAEGSITQRVLEICGVPYRKTLVPQPS
jgi:anti-anti-sigma factor